MTNINTDTVWGIDNDYGVLRDVLLGKPDYYRWTDAGPLTRRTFANAHKTGVVFDFELAQKQHAEMVRIYADAGVKTHFLPSDKVLHRNFFARDNSVMTPWGPLICHMQLKTRRADYVSVIEFYNGMNIPIWKYATAGHFEGGDFVILEPGSVLIGYGGERSEQEGSEQVGEWIKEKGWDACVAPIPALFVHMDGIVVPVAPKLAVACVSALEDWVVDWIQSRGFTFINVDFKDAKELGANIVTLGNNRILSMRQNTNLNETLRSHGFEVFDPDMSMFTLGGGGVHCLCQSMRREPA